MRREGGVYDTRRWAPWQQQLCAPTSQQAQDTSRVPTHQGTWFRWRRRAPPPAHQWPPQCRWAAWRRDARRVGVSINCRTASVHPQLCAPTQRASPNEHEVAATHAAGTGVVQALAQRCSNGGVNRSATLAQHRRACRARGRVWQRCCCCAADARHAGEQRQSHMNIDRPPAPSPISLQRPWSAATTPPADRTLRGRPA